MGVTIIDNNKIISIILITRETSNNLINNQINNKCKIQLKIMKDFQIKINFLIINSITNFLIETKEIFNTSINMRMLMLKKEILIHLPLLYVLKKKLMMYKHIIFF